LVLEFYDISNPTTLKKVVNLKAIGDGQTNGVVFNDATDDTKYLTNESSIMLPLRTGETSTTYHLILDSNSATNANEDILTFNYATQTVFVSRACGYKTIFNLNDPNGYSLSDATTPGGLWIQSVSVQTNSITTENETHIKISF